MMKKAYFLLLLPLALIPVAYCSIEDQINFQLQDPVSEQRVCSSYAVHELIHKTQGFPPEATVTDVSDDFFNQWIHIQQNQFIVSVIGRNTTLSLQNKTLNKTTFTLSFTTPKSIKIASKRTTQPRRNFSTQVPSRKKNKVPLKTFNFVLGPTSANYNETLPSDQVAKSQTKDVTVVSAYFKLPPFPKGSRGNMRTPNSYKQWMRAFRWIVNPIVIYTDDNETCTNLTEMFQKKNRTSVKVILIQREGLWSFQQMPEITKILKQKGYPVHYPNTVIPTYNCMTHSKFEILKKSIERNWFNTKYFIWVDIGYFRYPIDSDFGLDLPTNFDERRVGITVVGSLRKKVSLETSVRNNLNWIAGGCLLGRIDVLLTFCNEYLDFVKQGIKQKMVGVEQQMMYAMYSGENKPKTSLQLCSPGWFCMGRLAAQAWAIKHERT